MLREAVRSLWAEPRAPDPPPIAWWDWLLVGVLALAGAGEALFRPHLELRGLALVLAVAPAILLLWRRSHPLAVVIAASVLHVAVHDAPIHAHHDPDTGLYASAVVLLLPYALLRWGSGRDAVLGMLVLLGGHVFIPSADGGIGLLVTGIAVLCLPAALGASVRYKQVSHVSKLDQVRLHERAELARELHDTVAHHVSAIAIQAQAGRAVAAQDPDAAAKVLEVIEAEASRTLAEMRAMVGVLRRGDGKADVAPQPGVADLRRLAAGTTGAARVELDASGDLEDLAPSLDAAVYRLAQESITNAVRHARRATRIKVAVAGEPDCVRLVVTDDGEPAPLGAATGYGIVGMTERATLLGGTLEAGPDRARDRGWTVTAVLPRAGAAS